MMRIDPGLTERTEQARFDAARERLLERLLAEPQAAALPPSRRAAFRDWLDAMWQDGAVLRPDHPVTLQRYVLVQMTRHRWQDHPLLGAYAARMIGQPSEAWHLADGITAVYRNIVAARFLRPEIVAFIEKEAAA